MLVVGLLLGGAGSSDTSSHPSQGAVLPPATVSAPPSSDSATVSACAQVISAMPLTLDGQNVRRTVSTPASGAIQAWGDPPIVLRCGVSRPAALHAGSSAQFQSGGVAGGPYYDVTGAAGANVWTTVDRAVYIAVTVPSKYQGGDVMPTVSRAIAKVLPAVCSTNPQEPDVTTLCTRRK